MQGVGELAETSAQHQSLAGLLGLVVVGLHGCVWEVELLPLERGFPALKRDLPHGGCHRSAFPRGLGRG